MFTDDKKSFAAVTSSPTQYGKGKVSGWMMNMSSEEIDPEDEIWVGEGFEWGSGKTILDSKKRI